MALTQRVRRVFLRTLVQRVRCRLVLARRLLLEAGVSLQQPMLKARLYIKQQVWWDGADAWANETVDRAVPWHQGTAALVGPAVGLWLVLSSLLAGGMAAKESWGFLVAVVGAVALTLPVQVGLVFLTEEWVHSAIRRWGKDRATQRWGKRWGKRMMGMADEVDDPRIWPATSAESSHIIPELFGLGFWGAAILVVFGAMGVLELVTSLWPPMRPFWALVTELMTFGAMAHLLCTLVLVSVRLLARGAVLWLRRRSAESYLSYRLLNICVDATIQLSYRDGRWADANWRDRLRTELGVVSKLLVRAVNVSPGLLGILEGWRSELWVGRSTTPVRITEGVCRIYAAHLSSALGELESTLPAENGDGEGVRFFQSQVAQRQDGRTGSAG